MNAKPWVMKGCRWRIGDESSVLLWLDHWILDILALYQRESDLNNNRELYMVADIID